MNNKNIKIGSRVFLFSFAIAAVFFTVSAALADNKPYTLKVYSSESLGAGEQVFHISACAKTRSYAPLRCSEELYAKNPTLFGKQCVEKNKDGTDKTDTDSDGNSVPVIREGTLIKTCIDPQATIPGTAYVEADDNDVEAFNKGWCKEEPENQGYYYVPEWAVVQTGMQEDGQPIYLQAWDIKLRGTVTWPGGNSETPPEFPEDVLNDIYELEEEDPADFREIKPVFRPTLCGVFDRIAKEDGGSAVDEKSTEDIDNFKKILGGVDAAVGYDRIGELADTLIEDGCNNSNSELGKARVQGDVSTPFDREPSVSCSLRERITGRTGAEIFAKYIGALYRWAAGVVGIIAVLVFTFSGVQISMAGADSAKVDAAKNRIMQSLIGLVILFLSGLILYTINPTFFTG